MVVTENMVWVFLVAVPIMVALIGWRSWTLLRSDPPILRASGTVLSVFMPVPVFLIVIAYHYAKRAANPIARAPASNGTP